MPDHSQMQQEEAAVSTIFLPWEHPLLLKQRQVAQRPPESPAAVPLPRCGDRVFTDWTREVVVYYCWAGSFSFVFNLASDF